MSQPASDDIHQHSGWLIPLAFMGAIALLCAGFLVYYLRPGPRDGAPTGDMKIVQVRLRSLNLSVPSNYIKTAAGRSDGVRDSLALVAILPGLTGYSDDEKKLFATNAPDSPVLNLLLHGEDRGLTPQARLDRIYRPYLEAGAGTAGAFGLTHYGFQPDSAYAGSELFAGMAGGSLVLLLCEKPAPDLVSPNCIATDRPYAPGVSLSYRFKRAYLSRWGAIAQNVDALVARFAGHQPP